MISRFFRAATATLATLSAVAPSLAQTGGIVQGEALALARLTEVRSISRRFDRHIFPGFDAGEAPAVVFQPGAWAVAAGFPEPPDGFEIIPGVLDGERPVYRTNEAGGFVFHGRSPALVGGRWAVISRFEPPPVIPPGDYLGRPGAEEAIARFLADAFMIYQMEVRGDESPFPSGIPLYPDSAELTALTAVEHRLLLKSARMVNLNENNFDDFKDLARQIVAVRRERYKLMGPETAALEMAVERTYGMGDHIEHSVYRLAIHGGFITRPIFKDDPTYQKHGNSLLLRLIHTNYSMSHTPDNPAATIEQIRARYRSLGFLVNRLDDRLGWKGLEGNWREHALKGDVALIEILARGDESETVDDAELLERAKNDEGYLAFLRLAREDLIRLIRDRESLLAELFPAESTLQIRLGGGDVSLENDMAATTHLGKGRSLHSGSLEVEAPGLDLALTEYPLASRPRVMTMLDRSDRSLREIRIRLAGDTKVPETGALSPESPVLIETPGLRLEIRAGSLSRAPRGALILSLE